MGKQMTFPEWQAFAREVNTRADRVCRAIMRRAYQACREAGLDASIFGIHVHNALVSLHYGEPWEGVDYRKVRLARYLGERSFEPHRMAERIIARAWETVAR